MLRIVCPICYPMCESKSVLIRGEGNMLRFIIGWGSLLGCPRLARRCPKQVLQTSRMARGGRWGCRGLMCLNQQGSRNITWRWFTTPHTQALHLSNQLSMQQVMETGTAWVRVGRWRGMAGKRGWVGKGISCFLTFPMAQVISFLD